MKCVVVHYGEIGIKGQNRRYFEKKLVKNIKIAIKCKAERQRGRIILKGAKDKDVDKLKHIAGISSFSAAQEIPLSLARIKKAVIDIAKKSKKSKNKTFRITARRANKSFPITSMDLNKKLGHEVIKATKMKVDLHNPQLEIFVEIADKAYIYSEKQHAIEGLPVGTAGKLVCLLSGGIDSPVAAYRMMTRGCRIVFVHFHNYDPFRTKVEKLVRILSSYQHRSVLYMVPFKEVQQEIIRKTIKKGSKYRMLLYRRLMMQIAEGIAKREKALGMVTGDSVAQVASQTLQNLNVIHDAVVMPIFSPLIGSGKNEIIKQAKEIGTYETSILPYTDCCSVLIGKHPATRAQLKDVQKLEKKLRIGSLVKKASKKAELKKIQ